MTDNDPADGNGPDAVQAMEVIRIGFAWNRSSLTWSTMANQMWRFLKWCSSQISVTLSCHVRHNVFCLSWRTPTKEHFNHQLIESHVSHIAARTKLHSVSLDGKLFMFYERLLRGGNKAQWLAYLVLNPDALGSIPNNSEMFSEEKLSMLLRFVNGTA